MRLCNSMLLAGLSWAIADTHVLNISAGVQDQVIQTNLETCTDTNDCGLVSDVPDLFEPDNTFSNAAYSSDFPLIQCHTLHVSNDCDWVRFFADSNQTYTIQTIHLGANPAIDTVIEIYQEQTSLFDEPSVVEPPFKEVDVSDRECGESAGLGPQDGFTTGFYYAKVCQFPNDPGFEPGSYLLKIFIPTGPGITVHAWNLATFTKLSGATVMVTGDATVSNTTDNTGSVDFPLLNPGNYTVEVSVAHADIQGRSSFMPLFDPFRSYNSPTNPASSYGNPRSLTPRDFVTIPFSLENYSVIQFGFIPVAYVDAKLRDAITGEPVPGMGLTITLNNARMTEFSKKPWAAYGEPMTSSTDGSFGVCAPIFPNRIYTSFKISDAEGRYEVIESASNRTAPGQGYVLNLGDIWLEPRFGTPDGTNSIPNPWEWEYGIHVTNWGKMNLDSDSDGLSNEQEYIADTDPKNSNEVFRVERPPGEDQGKFVLTWDLAPLRIYEIYRTTDFGGEANWINVHDVTNTENRATMSWTDQDSTNENDAVYRVDVTGVVRAYNEP